MTSSATSRPSGCAGRLRTHLSAGIGAVARIEDHHDQKRSGHTGVPGFSPGQSRSTTHFKGMARLTENAVTMGTGRIPMNTIDQRKEVPS
jgi:hypothetical protein